MTAPCTRCAQASDYKWLTAFLVSALVVVCISQPCSAGQTYTISGRVKCGLFGFGIRGVKLYGLPGDPKTDSDGDYHATVPEGWSGSVFPQESGLHFDPVGRSYTNVTSNIEDNYKTTLPTPMISGYVRTAGGTAIPLVTMSGLPDTPMTNSSGFYTAAVSSGFDGTVTPTRSGYTFTPPSRTYSDVGSDMSDEHYTGESSPGAPTGVGASDGEFTDKVRVTWQSTPSATSYEVWRHTSDDSASATRLAASVTATSYDDTTATPGALYYYWVKATSAQGTSAFSASDSGHRALSPPTGVAASDGTHTDKVAVTWDASVGATSYEVWRHTSDEPASATRLAASVIPTSYDDTTATPGTLYYYWVKAASAQGTSAFSASDSGLRARPATVCVDDGNTSGEEDGSEQHPYNTIQEAIDAVAHGGTVKVAQGSYAGSLTIAGKAVTIQGGYVGGTYPGTGDFSDASRDPDPTTNQTVIDGGGAPAAVECQDAAARGSTLDGLTIRNAGAIFRSGVRLRRVLATSN